MTHIPIRPLQLFRPKPEFCRFPLFACEFSMCCHPAKFQERRQRSFSGIQVQLHYDYSPKGLNTTAQGRDALVAHPGC